MLTTDIPTSYKVLGDLPDPTLTLPPFPLPHQLNPRPYTSFFPSSLRHSHPSPTAPLQSHLLPHSKLPLLNHTLPEILARQAARGSHLLTPASNFSATFLPPLGILPQALDGWLGPDMQTGCGSYGTGNAAGRRMDDLEEVDTEELPSKKMDLGTMSELTVNSNVHVGQTVEIRRLLIEEETWTPWQRGTVTRKSINKAFLGSEYLCYEVQVPSACGKSTPDVHYVTPYTGEFWDLVGPRPVNSPQMAIELLIRLRMVFTPRRVNYMGNIVQMWMPARITSAINDPQIRVQFVPQCELAQYPHPHTACKTLYQNYLALIPSTLGTDMDGVCECERIPVEVVLPFTRLTAERLKARGDVIVPGWGF